jgi:hypothetical protein
MRTHSTISILTAVPHFSARRGARWYCRWWRSLCRHCPRPEALPPVTTSRSSPEAPTSGGKPYSLACWWSFALP